MAAGNTIAAVVAAGSRAVAGGMDAEDSMAVVADFLVVATALILTRPRVVKRRGETSSPRRTT